MFRNNGAQKKIKNKNKNKKITLEHNIFCDTEKYAIPFYHKSFFWLEIEKWSIIKNTLKMTFSVGSVKMMLLFRQKKYDHSQKIK